MRYDDEEIGSLGDLVEKLRQQTDPNNTIWFRGQTRAEWQLIPSLARNQNLLSQEMKLIKRFIQLAIPQMTEYIPTTSDDWDWVFLMQHHHVPTRLLDWSENPLAALWFALFSERDDDTPAAIWCLDPIALNGQAKFRGRWAVELPAFGRDNILDNYLPEKQADGTGAFPAAAIASRQFRRIAAQQGNFTISHSDSVPIDEVGDRNHVWKIIVPAHAKVRLREDLKYLRFTELLLFPDLDRAASAALASF